MGESMSKDDVNYIYRVFVLFSIIFIFWASKSQAACDSANIDVAFQSTVATDQVARYPSTNNFLANCLRTYANRYVEADVTATDLKTEMSNSNNFTEIARLLSRGIYTDTSDRRVLQSLKSFASTVYGRCERDAVFIDYTVRSTEPSGGARLTFFQRCQLYQRLANMELEFDRTVVSTAGLNLSPEDQAAADRCRGEPNKMLDCLQACFAGVESFCSFSRGDAETERIARECLANPGSAVCNDCRLQATTDNFDPSCTNDVSRASTDPATDPDADSGIGGGPGTGTDDSTSPDGSTPTDAAQSALQQAANNAAQGVFGGNGFFQGGNLQTNTNLPDVQPESLGGAPSTVDAAMLRGGRGGINSNNGNTALPATARLDLPPGNGSPGGAPPQGAAGGAPPGGGGGAVGGAIGAGGGAGAAPAAAGNRRRGGRGVSRLKALTEQMGAGFHGTDGLRQANAPAAQETEVDRRVRKQLERSQARELDMGAVQNAFNRGLTQQQRSDLRIQSTFFPGHERVYQSLIQNKDHLDESGQ
jgi:hypothetical protein